MANVKISQLPSLSTMTDLAQIPVVAGGTTYQITGSNLSAYFSTSAAGSKIVNGSTEANIGASGGNANISVGGISNVAVFTQSGVIVSGVLTAPVLTTNNIRSDDSSFVNIEDGVNITGAVIAAGNVVGNYFIGNGSQLTGVSSTGNLDITGTTIKIAAGASETVLEISPNNSPGWAYLKLPNDATSNTVDTQLNNDNGNVSIGTGGDQFGVFPTWLFDNTGNLTLPEGGSLFSQSSTPSGSPGNTIVLQPAGSGVTTGQKLMIYPTANDGDHIHLTSGNLYQTELFLGSDNFYVKLANTGDIVVQTDGGVFNTAQWTFGSGGTLTLPNNSSIKSATDIDITIDTPDSSTFNWQFGADGSLTLPIGVSIDNNVNPLYPKIIADSGKLFSVQGQGNTGSAALAWTVNPNAASQYAAVAVTRAGGDSLAKVVLQAQSDSGNAATAKIWQFDETGTLTVPAANGVPGRISTQTTLANEKGFDLRITAGNTDGCTVPGGDMYLSAGVGYNGVSHGAGNVNIVTGDRNGGNTGNIWRFDSSGALTLPLGNATIKNTAGNAVAFGLNAGLTSQGANAVAIGINSGVYSQSASAVAIGALAGNGGRVSTNYVSGAVSPSTTLVVTSTTGIVPGMIITGTGFFGTITVVTVTNSTTLEISASAVFTPSGALTFTGSQGDNSVAIGTQAGQVQQGQFAVAIGDNAGNSGQGTDAVAIGASAGLRTQGAGAVAFGQGTGEISQGANAVAIGKAAGQVSQGINSVAIGQSAGLTNQGNNSIILNATGSALEQTTANTFTVAPVRNDVANTGQVVFYNTTSKEITYGNVISVTGNIIGGNLSAVNLVINNIRSDDSSFVNIEDGVNVTGAIDASGNITGGYILGNGSQLTGVNAVTVDVTDTNGLTTIYYPTFVENRTTAQIARADVNLTYRTDDNLLTVGNVSVTGNIDGGNLNAAGLSLSGNVVSAINTIANITTTANISGGYILGNGSLLTGLPATYGNANVVANLAALGTNPVSTTGNITGGNLITAGAISAASVSASGNITGGNIVTGGIGGNISGANIISGTTLSATSKVITAPVAYSTLTAVTGARAFVNDGNLVASGNFGAQVSGGGANTVPVWSNGTNWYIG